MPPQDGDRFQSVLQQAAAPPPPAGAPLGDLAHLTALLQQGRPADGGGADAGATQLAVSAFAACGGDVQATMRHLLGRAMSRLRATPPPPSPHLTPAPQAQQQQRQAPTLQLGGGQAAMTVLQASSGVPLGPGLHLSGGPSALGVVPAGGGGGLPLPLLLQRQQGGGPAPATGPAAAAAALLRGGGGGGGVTALQQPPPGGGVQLHPVLQQHESQLQLQLQHQQPHALLRGGGGPGPQRVVFNMPQHATAGAPLSLGGPGGGWSAMQNLQGGGHAVLSLQGHDGGGSRTLHQLLAGLGDGPVTLQPQQPGGPYMAVHAAAPPPKPPSQAQLLDVGHGVHFMLPQHAQHGGGAPQQLAHEASNVSGLSHGILGSVDLAALLGGVGGGGGSFGLSNVLPVAQQQQQQQQQHPSQQQQQQGGPRQQHTLFHG